LIGLLAAASFGILGAWNAGASAAPEPPRATAPRAATPATSAPAKPSSVARASAAPSKKYTAEELKKLDVTKACGTAECHVEFSKMEFRHGPSAQGKCDPCHVSIGGKHVFQPVDKSNALCLTCHDPLPQKKVKHDPVHKNCRECHEVHGENDRFFLVGKDVVELCNRCHKDTIKGLPVEHGPVAQGLCLACHEPHESDNAALLIAPMDKFCGICHQEIADQGVNALVVHKPFEDECVGCHAGHESNYKNLLLTPEGELCKKCHEKEIEAAHNFKVQHEPVSNEKECSTCHTAHFSDFQGLLREASMPVCLSCHNKEYPREKGRPVRNVEAELSKAKFIHGPIRDKNCLPCHDAHGSQYVNLLSRNFPARFYAPFELANYELCFFCHEQRIVLEAKSLDTNFRNGNINMHFLHVNREKGRTCRACHAEHASNNPVHIRDSVPYGQWEMPIEFEKTATGGACSTGCHSRYGYDRENPVKNFVKGQ
jgi:predicted CXXCH cytochrome family protein